MFNSKFLHSALSMVLVLAMVVGCAGALTGCNGSGENGANKDGKITLTVTVSSAEVGSREVFEKYMKDHPNVIIEEVPTSNGDTKLLSMIASGSPPDIIRFAGYDELPAFVQRGILMPLDDYLKKSDKFKESDMFDAIKTCRFDGEKRGKGSLYGVPKDWSPIGLWINKNAFNDAGIPLPSTTAAMTWDEFADIATKLVKKNGKNITRHGVITALPLPTLLEMYLSGYGKSMWKNNYNTTTLTSSDTQDAVKYFQKLQESAALASTLYPNADGIGTSALNEDKVGMVLGGYWFRGAYAGAGTLSDVQDKLMYVPAPVGTNKACYALDLTCLGIFSETDNPEAAWDLLEYLVLDEYSVTTRSKIGFNLPISKKYMDTLPYETEFDKQALGVVKNYQLNNFDPVSVSVCPWISYTSLTTLFDKFYLPVLYNKSTLADAMKTINKETELLISEGKDLVGAD